MTTALIQQHSELAHRSTKTLWVFAITSIAVFMTTLDNLVVTSAIPVIRHDLHAGINGLEIGRAHV